MSIPQIPLGLCQCGCGQRTKIAASNDPRTGEIKGQPRRWIKGHWTRVHNPALQHPSSRIQRTCAYCGAPFQVFPSELQQGTGAGTYCSKPCSGAARTAALLSRFWPKVDQSGGPDACWPWLASKDSHGYGQIAVKHCPQRASRVAWELTHGSIPPGIEVCHRCDNPPCCNPAHLFLGTRRVNAQDCSQKGRTTRGERAAGVRLTAEQVLAIRAQYAAKTATLRALAEAYGVTQGAIELIVYRKRWRHL